MATAAQSRKYLSIMREVYQELSGEFQVVDNNKLRNACIHEFLERTKLTSGHTGKKYYNMVLNDMRELIPVGERVIGVLENVTKDHRRVDALLDNIAEDLEALNECEEGVVVQRLFDEGYDKEAKALIEMGALNTKDRLRTTFLKTIGTKNDLNKTMGDVAIKLLKSNTEKDRNDILEKKNKSVFIDDGFTYEVLENQFSQIQAMKAQIAAKYQDTKLIEAQGKVIQVGGVDENSREVPETQEISS